MIRTGRHSERRNMNEAASHGIRFITHDSALPPPNISAIAPRQDGIGPALHKIVRAIEECCAPESKTKTHHTAARQSVGPLFYFPNSPKEQQMTDPTKIDMLISPNAQPISAEVADAKKPRAPKKFTGAETVERGKRDRAVITGKTKKAVPKKATKVKVKKVAKSEPKLPAAAVERLRNGTSSIPMETKTLGLAYSVIQRALKRELGTAGYTALIKANRAAKSKATKPKAAKKSKPAKAAGKKRSR